jgi:hypothetical protein
MAGKIKSMIGAQIDVLRRRLAKIMPEARKWTLYNYQSWQQTKKVEARADQSGWLYVSAE